MKSYSVVSAAFLMTAAWLAPIPRVHAAQQSAPKADITQKAAAASATGNQTNATAPSAPAKPGFYILAELTQSLNAKKLKPGDQVKAEVAQDVLSHGKIIIPVESKLIGHVTEVKAHQAGDPESRLGIVFDKVLLKHPREVDFLAVVQRLEPPTERRSRVDQPSQLLPAGGWGGPTTPTPVSAGTNNGAISLRGGPSSGGSSIAAAPAGPTFSPPPSPSDPPSSARNGTGPVALVKQQRSMSTGMPMGVYGLKGLSLLPGPSGSTPGPIILSQTGDVKLENGTQILLRVTDAGVPQP